MFSQRSHTHYHHTSCLLWLQMYPRLHCCLVVLAVPEMPSVCAPLMDVQGPHHMLQQVYAWVACSRCCCTYVAPMIWQVGLHCTCCWGGCYTGPVI